MKAVWNAKARHRLWLGRFSRQYLRIRAEVLQGGPRGTCQTESHGMRMFANERIPEKITDDMCVLIAAQPIGGRHLRRWFSYVPPRNDHAPN